MSLAACLCYRAIEHFARPRAFGNFPMRGGGRGTQRAQRRVLHEGSGWQIGGREDAGKSKKRGTSPGPIAHLNAANASRSHRPRGSPFRI